jgi:hypothetical protein
MEGYRTPPTPKLTPTLPEAGHQLSVGDWAPPWAPFSAKSKPGSYFAGTTWPRISPAALSVV